MGVWKYEKGVTRIGPGVYAYLCPDGSWGFNNAGLIVDRDRAMLIDTLFDLDSTREMLEEMKATVQAASSIETLVITHGNGDHFYGNELVRGAEIVATEACAEEMAAAPPQMLAELAAASPRMGDVGRFFLKCFGGFRFDGIRPLPPTRTFRGRLDLRVGGKEVRLIQVGPAHTAGDAIVHLPSEGVVFAGDILFIGGTPIMWAGPAANWIRACDLILQMDADVIVPGHGPITDKTGVGEVKTFWEYMTSEARKRYDAGMSEKEAVTDIPLGPYASLTDTERIVVNVNALYREFRGDTAPPSVLELFASMAALGLKK